jgi:hypothetical protein
VNNLVESPATARAFAGDNNQTAGFKSAPSGKISPKIDIGKIKAIVSERILARQPFFGRQFEFTRTTRMEGL